jgi:hypothetical protein
MKEQFVTYDIALKLKELGFNEKCFAEYNESKVLLYLYPHECFHGYCNIDDFEPFADILSIKAPLYQQVIDWLREKHDLHINVITRYHELYNKRYWQFTIFRISQPNNNRVEESDFMYDTFDKNIKQAILKAIELIKLN